MFSKLTRTASISFLRNYLVDWMLHWSATSISFHHGIRNVLTPWNHTEILPLQCSDAKFMSNLMLTTQVRVNKFVWANLQQAQHDQGHEKMSWVHLDQYSMPRASDFSCPSWSKAMLATPWHVGMKGILWRSYLRHADSLWLIIFPAFNAVQEHQLNLEEKVVLATKPKEKQQKQTERTWLITDKMELALSMEVMVMFNVSMDLNMANRA